MAVKFIVVHRKDPNNVGDLASQPLQYFLKEDEYETIDVVNFGNQTYNQKLPMIVGGGGLIGNEFIGDFMRYAFESPDALQLERMFADRWTLSNLEYKNIYDEFNIEFGKLVGNCLSEIRAPTAPRFLWGVGHNGSPDTEFTDIRWPKAMAKFKEVGIRDFSERSKFRWTPCASCMHSAFDKNYEIKNDIIWFEHKKQLLKDFGDDPIPRFINSGNNFEQTIELLGSSNIILTNSYHGAYWGTLLRKRVIIVGGAWSSKFKFMKHQPVICGKKEDWKEMVEQATVYENALYECRAANVNLWESIQGHL